MQPTTSTPLSTLRLNPDLPRRRPAPLPRLKSQQIMTIGAPDAYRCDYTQLATVPTPEPTFHPRSGNVQWQPVGFTTLADHCRDVMGNMLDADPIFETYALNRNNNQMFGMIGFGSGHSGHAITIAMRSSLDKSIAPAAAIGSAPTVCANGIFNGEYMIKAKQTTNVFDTLNGMIQEICTEAIEPIRQRIEMLQTWKDIPVRNDLFGAYMGVLFSRGLIKPQEFTAAFRYWNACHNGDLHDEHGQYDLFSAYQAVTAAGQRTAPRGAFAHYAGIDHATRAIADAGGSVTEAYIPSFDLQIREYVEAGEAK